MKQINKLKLVALSFILFNFTALASPSFDEAKKNLKVLYKLYDAEEFYCGCALSSLKFDLKSCGYKIRKDPVRAKRIEWEHVMPASYFGNRFKCWKSGRTKCRTNKLFSSMEGDMHNLQPAIGEVNLDRSNFKYELFTNNYNQYGRCQFAVDAKRKRVQPRESIRGIIARSYLYMQQKYNIKLTPSDQKQMENWHLTYPPNQFECNRNKHIEKLQGNDNPSITNNCK